MVVSMKHTSVSKSKVNLIIQIYLCESQSNEFYPDRGVLCTGFGSNNIVNFVYMYKMLVNFTLYIGLYTNPVTQNCGCVLSSCALKQDLPSPGECSFLSYHNTVMVWVVFLSYHSTVMVWVICRGRRAVSWDTSWCRAPQQTNELVQFHDVLSRPVDADETTSSCNSARGPIAYA